MICVLIVFPDLWCLLARDHLDKINSLTKEILSKCAAAFYYTSSITRRCLFSLKHLIYFIDFIETIYKNSQKLIDHTSHDLIHSVICPFASNVNRRNVYLFDPVHPKSSSHTIIVQAYPTQIFNIKTFVFCDWAAVNEHFVVIYYFWWT